MKAPDALIGEMNKAVIVLAELPAGHAQLQMFLVRDASMRSWAKKQRFDKVQGVIEAMLKGLHEG
jgi:hypothetical protein